MQGAAQVLARGWAKCEAHSRPAPQLSEPRLAAGKLLAFSGPSPVARVYYGFKSFMPEDYWAYFRARGVTAVVRLNKQARTLRSHSRDRVGCASLLWSAARVQETSSVSLLTFRERYLCLQSAAGAVESGMTCDSQHPRASRGCMPAGQCLACLAARGAC